MEPKQNTETTFDPPAELSPFAQSVWRMIVPARARSTGRLLLLRRALAAHDEAARCGEILRREGLLAKALGGKMPHLHPLAKHRDEQLKAFDTCWSKLGLEHANIDGMIDGAWQKQPGIGLPIDPAAAQQEGERDE